VSLSGGSLRLNIQHNRGSIGGLPEIAGSVTDPTGAAIPGADVTLRQLAGTASSNAKTDEDGQFRMASLPAGSYELQIVAPGFRKASGQIELQPQDVALVASILSVGSTAESIEVSAAAAATDTASASETAQILNNGPAMGLPINGRDVYQLQAIVPSTATAARGKSMLTVNSAGALLFSRNAGKNWKTVKPVWQGKVVRIATLTEPGPAFQLATDSGSIWLSRDGTHWYPAPPQH